MSTQGTNEREIEEVEGDASAEESRELSLFQNGGTQQLLHQWHGMGGNYGGESVEYNVATEEQLLECCSPIQLLQPNHNEGGAQPQWPNSHAPPLHHPTTAFGRTQEIQFRGLGDSAAPSNTFYPPPPPSSYQIPNTPQRLVGGYMGVHSNYYVRDMEDSPSRNVRMRMTVEDNRVPYGGQLQPSENPKPPRAMRNSVYDPMYEDMGLPVDPHLRMFLAKRNQGKD